MSTSPFSLSEEHEDFRAAVAEFAADRVAPGAADRDAEHRFPVELVGEMGGLGLFGLSVPEHWGGAGDFTSLCIAIEELGRVDQAVGITLEAGVGLGINPIARYGSDAQREQWLPDLVAGRALAGFGLTEPEAGSDAGATRTKAELVDGQWVLNGAKEFITNSGTPLTSLVTVTARTGTNPDGTPELSAIVVPTNTPGFTVEPAYRKLGWHASDTHPLSFRDCAVPEDHLLGERGAGYRQFLSTLDDGRVAIAALALGCIRACRDFAVEHALVRTTFGKPIGARQGVAFDIADLDAMAESCRLLVYAAAAAKDQMGDEPTAAERKSFKRLAAIAKLQTTEAAVTATRTATQVLGGYGFIEEHPVARFYRDAKILEIGEGTSQVQRMLIARGLGLPVE